MLKRAAKSDIQMEEHANYVSISDELDSELRGCLLREKSKRSEIITDTSAKTFIRMRGAHKNQVLSGSRKQDIIARRTNVDPTLQKMYYETVFK